MLAAALLAASAPRASAQRVAVSTNLPTYALMGSINFSADFAIGQHSTIGAAVKFSPFDFKYNGETVYFHHVTPSINYHYWFWNYYSGWYAGAKFQYGVYNSCNIRNFNAQGSLVGAGIDFGYGWMLSHHLNLTIGIGGFGGYTWYTRYTDPSFNWKDSFEGRFFIMPDDLTLALTFVF